MSLLNFFKNRKKNTASKEKEIIIDDSKRYIDKECELCKKVIGYEHYSKQQGKYFHKKCYKNALSQVRSNGIVVR